MESIQSLPVSIWGENAQQRESAARAASTNVLVSLVAVGALFLLGLLGVVPGMGWFFGVVVPYLAVTLFLFGLIYRVMAWANVPVPFRIPTTCGQQKSLAWIKQAQRENPHNTLAGVGRLALDVLFFRSLLRNTKWVGGRRDSGASNCHSSSSV